MALYKDLLGHNLEKLAGVTVFDVTLYDGDRPLLTFDTLTISNVSVEGEQKEIRGGQGGNLLLSYDYAKTANLEITDALASIYSLKYIWGAQIKHEEITALVRRKLEFDGAVIAVPQDRKPNTLVTIMAVIKEGGQEIHKIFEVPEEVFLLESEGKLDLTPTFPVDEFENPIIPKFKSLTAYYTAEVSNSETDNHIYELTLTTTDFPRVVRLVGETFFVDAMTGKKIYAQVEIPKFKPSSNFELTFESEGDASVFDFSGTALVDDDRLIIVRTLGYEGEADTCEVHEIAGFASVETIDFTENLLENLSIWKKDDDEWILCLDEGTPASGVAWTNDWEQNGTFTLTGDSQIIFQNGNEIHNDGMSSVEIKVCWNLLTIGKNPQE